MAFVNRTEELAALESWWNQPGSAMGVVWGRRRVGKTALLQQFAMNRRHLFHTAAGRPAGDELRALSASSAPVLGSGFRDLIGRPFTDWSDALETFADAARSEPLLVVLDEFPELLGTTPELPGIVRAVSDRVRTHTQLRLLISGSAVRVLSELQEARAPLFGRLNLRLQLHPFRPHEAAQMLPRLSAAQQALVWGVVGGIPLYLEWWDDRTSVRSNLERLACTPGGLLLTEGELLLATGGDTGDLGRPVLYAIATGRTRHNEIADAIRADPTRTLERLVELRLVERLVPVTEDPARTRRRSYRISDNFLAFWLGVLDRYRPEIERGLGRTIAPVLVSSLGDHMGPRWEEAVRMHLRRIADRGELGPNVVAIGPFWTMAGDPVEIDAVALAGRSREAVLVTEAKWSRSVDGAAVRRALERKATALPRVSDRLRYAVAAREAVKDGDVVRITARDVFGA
jgi:AAA+ ATPase superfamily predicted ATPase